MEYNDEEWRDVPGYEGVYLISNYGRVKRLPIGKQWSYRRTHNNIRKLKISSTGYYRVNLSKDNQVKFYNVHRLVALAFIPNPDDLPQVNHKDENKLNNHVSNLEWCSAKYNCIWGTGRERQKASRKMSDKTNNSRQIVGEKNSKKVCQRDLNGNAIAYFKSISDAAKQIDGNISDISRCCHGLARQSKGYKWSFV